MKLLALFFVVAACIAATAQAEEQWPFYGGDQGRSGHQPLDPGAVPALAGHANTGATEDRVQNSPIVTGGPLEQRAYAFGTEDAGTSAASGHVQLQSLESGQAIGLPQGRNIDGGPGDDEDTFGGITSFENVQGQGASFVEWTDNQGSQIFVVHNDDNQSAPAPAGDDIAFVPIDARNGTPGNDEAVPGTDTCTISSSPVLGPERDVGSARERDLFFIAYCEGADPAPDRQCDPFGIPADSLPDCPVEETKLFKLVLSNPEDSGGPDTTVASTDSAVIPGAPRGLASPTLAYLNPSSGMKLFVLVPGGAGVLRAWDAEVTNLPDTPAFSRTFATSQQVMTPAVPVNKDGTVPKPAPFVFVAVGESTGSGTANANLRATVYRLKNTDLSDDGPTGQSGDLPGTPSASLGVDMDGANPGAGGHVVLTTSRNLFNLDADNLTRGGSIAPANDRAAGTTGFSRNSPALSSELAFVQQDNGLPLAVNLESTRLFPDNMIERYGSHDDKSTAVGQPAISGRYLTFGHGTGTYVYRLQPPVGILPDPAAGSRFFSVSDASVVEGNSGTRQLSFTVSLSGPLGATTLVDYATANGTASAPGDFGATSGRVTFSPGQTSKTVTVNVNGDTTVEDTEEFTLRLTRPIGAEIADGQGTGSIVNDDQAPPTANPSLVIGDTSLQEGDSGQRTAVFTVALSRAAAAPVQIAFATADGTARSGSDYLATRGTLAFQRGQLTRTIAVPIRGDARFERNERFSVRLSAPTPGIDLGKSVGTGTIVNDDRRAPRALRVTVSPSRDRSFPYTFRVSGQVVLPKGTTRARGCRGRVSAQYKAGTRTISSRRGSVNRQCRFTVTTRFTVRNRIPRNGRLRLTVRFLGNSALAPARTRTRTVRAG